MNWIAVNPKVHAAELTGSVTYLYVLADNWDCPLASVWGRVTGGEKVRFETLHSYTVPFARRQGLRAMVNEHIFARLGVDVIVSGDGTHEGGLEFLKASGYKLHKPTGTWYLTIREQRRKRHV